MVRYAGKRHISERAQRVRELRARGLTTREIARLLGVAAGTVINDLRREGAVGPRQFDFDGVARVMEAHQRARERVTAKLADAPEGVRQALRTVDSALTDIRSAIVSTAERALEVESRADLYADRKRDAIDRLAAEADERITDALRTAQAALQVAEAEAISAALPRAPRRSEDAQLARQDALTILDRTPDNRLSEVLARLARRADGVAGLVLSTWGEDYLVARLGEHKANREHNAAIAHAIQAAGRDPERAPAAQALQALGQLSGVVETAVRPWQHAREALEVRVGYTPPPAEPSFLERLTQAADLPEGDGAPAGAGASSGAASEA